MRQGIDEVDVQDSIGQNGVCPCTRTKEKSPAIHLPTFFVKIRC